MNKRPNPSIRLHSLNRLTGLALVLLVATTVAAQTGTDWPMWNFDPAQSGMTPMELPETLHLQWIRELPPPRRAWPRQFDDGDKLEFDLSYAPIVMGDQVFVSSMVTDSVTAYRLSDGSKRWRAYADGPMRLAPAAWNGRVYAVSDDGHLYCLDAETGERLWRFNAAPTGQLVLGNNRVISMWAARGAPVVKDGTVYFAAGVWPFMGTFVFALDAVTGDVVWRNTGDYANWQRQPHGGAYSFAGIAPQGYLAVSGNRLVVSGGRSTPALLDRHTGELLHLDIFGVVVGGYRIKADGEFYYNHGRRHRLSDGSYVGSGRLVNESLRSRASELAEYLDAPPFSVIAAHNRLLITTTTGNLYAFGADAPGQPARHAYAPANGTTREPSNDRERDILQQAASVGEGYILCLGIGDGSLIEQLALQSQAHIVGIDPDETKIDALRRRFDEAGLYGVRIALLYGDPPAMQLPPYIASMIVVETPASAGMSAEAVHDLLRPYGGTAYYADQVIVREGPLPGAGQWTHQYADAARTTVSRDERVRLPLGVLWYGSESHDNILPRHAAGPRPQIAGGRLVILGVESINARDVYTGRELWSRAFPGIGHPFTNLELEEQWRDGQRVYMSNIPGAAYIGSPYVTLPDSIYLRHQGQIYRLDPQTGETLGTFALYPPEADIKPMDWGPVTVYEDLLITTTSPHQFDDTKLGWVESWNATSSRHLLVMDRFTGELRWNRTSEVGFRHNAIAAGNGKLFVIDGLSEQALSFLERRETIPKTNSRIIALNAADGQEIWQTESNVFGTYLAYSVNHDVLLESGSRDTRRALPDEPHSQVAARRGSDGTDLWNGRLQFPAAILGDRLIPARPGGALDVLTGDRKVRTHPITGQEISERYSKFYGCSAINASTHLLLFRSGAAGFADLEHESGTGNFGGFKSGCTASMIAADGVLNAPDYTRTCTCSYQNQTSLGLIHMPGAEVWTSYADGRGRGPIQRVGINLGAPGNRRAQDGTFWTPAPTIDAPSPDLTVLINTVDFADTSTHLVALAASRGGRPEHTIDGDPNTAWRISCNRSGTFDQSIRYTLNQPMTLDRLTVTWNGPEGTQFRIETRLNRDEWTTVAESTSQGTDGEPLEYRFDPIDATQIQLVFGDHADTREDSRGRRVQQSATIAHVRIGGLADPDAYAYFMPKSPFRRHALEIDGDNGLSWVAASGINGIRELILPDVGGGEHAYRLILHFAEWDDVQPGDRVFDVIANTKLIAKAFDILEATGEKLSATTLTVDNLPIGNSLQLTLRPVEGSRLPPLLSGVELVRNAD